MTASPLARRFATGALALVVSLSASRAFAQGATPPGPPATGGVGNPNTPTAPKNGKSPEGVLRGVPATVRDPAPPGERGVLIDRPAPAAKPRANTSEAKGVMHAEGIVTRIDRKGNEVNGELERFAFDPSQDWNSYVTRGPQGVMDKDADRPKSKAEVKEANTKVSKEEAGGPQVMEMAITKRTYTYAYARAEDGTDLYGSATSATPELGNSLSGNVSRLPTPGGTMTPKGPAPSNFTNMKEGSFVSVRYRKVGDVNEVMNLTLIDLPLNPVNTAPTRTAAPAATGARTPTIPKTPVGANIPK